MRRDRRAYLHDILTAADDILGFAKDATFADYLENEMLRSAIERKFEIIGEALSQLAKLDNDLARRISDWRDIIAFRNILVHNYAAIDHAIVWRAQTEQLPRLRDEVAALLALAPDR